jgi:predicted nucleic acid-binding protein
LAISKVGYAEMHAGLARRFRAGQLSAAAHRRIGNRFDAAWLDYVQVDLADPLLIIARDVVQRRPLRGFDAIHLASALRLQNQLDEAVRFVASDARLLEAAKSEGLRVLDVRI